MLTYTVSEFTKLVKGLFTKTFPETVTVTGEVSNLSRASSGHIYFSLKDNSAQLRAAFFRQYSSKAGVFIPKNGDKVKAIGDISLYEPDGSYQILVKRVFYDSEGDFWKKFEETKRRLEAEGLFEEARKKSLPVFPIRVALITSLSGAAVKDFITTSRKEGGRFRIDLWGVPVQGFEAAAKIVAAIKKAGGMAEFYDAAVIMRGGGSLEDLAVFNDESIARAAAASKVPVISAVGHERDFTIIDFVSDKRVATPTAAGVLLSAGYKRAESLVEERFRAILNAAVAKLGKLSQRVDLLELKILNSSPSSIIAIYRNRISAAEKDLFFHTKNRLGFFRNILDRVSSVLRSRRPDNIASLYESRIASLEAKAFFHMRNRLVFFRNLVEKASGIISAADPKNRIPALDYKLKSLSRRLKSAVMAKTAAYSARLEAAAGNLKLLDPENVLERGYALVFKEGSPITGVSALVPKDFIEIKLKDGYIHSFVDSIISEGIDGKDTDNS